MALSEASSNSVCVTSNGSDNTAQLGKLEWVFIICHTTKGAVLINFSQN